MMIEGQENGWNNTQHNYQTIKTLIKMESITLQTPRKPRINIPYLRGILIIVLIVFLLGAFNTWRNAQYTGAGASIVQMSVSDMSQAELERLERWLQSTLASINAGKPLTEAEAENLSKLYDTVVAMGGQPGGVVSRLLELIKEISTASAAVELSLGQSNMDNNERADDIPGVGGQ